MDEITRIRISIAFENFLLFCVFILPFVALIGTGVYLFFCLLLGIKP